jgi:RNA-binding protein
MTDTATPILSSPTIPSPAPVTGAQKRELKARAQLLDAVVRIGQAGVTAAVIASLEEALALHGLVKVRFSEFKDQRDALARQLATETGSQLIQQVGNVAVFFKSQPPQN